MLLVVSNKLGRLGGNLLENVVDERVHDGHGFLGDSGFWVNLLEDSVDVDAEGLGSSALGGFLGSRFGGSSLGDGSSSGFLGTHFCFVIIT